MSKLEKGIAIAFIILLAIFIVPVLIPIVGGNSQTAWFILPAFILGIILVPIAIAKSKD